MIGAPAAERLGRSRVPNRRHGPPGPCELHLESALIRHAPWVRVVVIGLCGLLEVLGYQPGLGSLGVAVWVAIVATAAAQAQFRDAAPTTFLTADLVLPAAFGLSQLGIGAQPVTGAIAAGAAITSVSCYFEWPDRPAAAHAVAAITIAGYLAGTWLSGGDPGPLVLRLPAQAALAWFGLMFVRWAARRCDRVVRHAAERRTEAAADRARQAADLAYLAVLHDTASTTFLMVSTDTTGDFDWLAGQADRDLRLLTAAPEGPHSTSRLDLACLLDTLRGDHGLQTVMCVQPGLLVPQSVGWAIYLGVREALVNVRRPSGDLRPSVHAARTDNGVAVCVSDAGRGFDPLRVPPHRRGLTHSIVARMVSAGGRCDVQSAPGQGTVVRWWWPGE